MEKEIISTLKKMQSDEKAEIFSRFFKTGKGEYGEGDTFWGIAVPQTRGVAKKFTDAPFQTISALIDHPVHEVRLCGFLILAEQFHKARKIHDRQKEIVRFYIDNSRKANNWDLVDLSAPKILGEWLLDNPEPSLLDEMSRSDSLWQQRLAIVATLPLIRAGRFDDTLRLAMRYLTHPHPLMHKATGWMLRETGKKELPALITFLDSHYRQMPRTALRYAIERLPEEQRRYYMKK